MGLFTNPLGYAGYPPGVTGRPTTQPTAVRAATSAEVTQAQLNNVYISPATRLSAMAAPSVSGASPVVNNARNGQASFTDVIANAAYGTLTVTNSLATTASVIIAVCSCTTANSACSIVGIVPTAGSIAFRIYNAGSASTAANINVNYWVLN